ncbi:MAG TPA: hypothetical protein V6C81_27175 [Planktothrix sp.]|jgi:hypothetical protein
MKNLLRLQSRRHTACAVVALVLSAGVPIAQSTDAAKSSQANATGTLLTYPFTPTSVTYNNSILVFRSNVRAGGSGMRLAIGFDGDEVLPGKTMTVSGGLVKGASHKIWSISRTINGANHRSLSKSGYDNYELRIRFYNQKGSVLPGYIDLSIRDERTVLKGYFFAQKGPENQVFL